MKWTRSKDGIFRFEVVVRHRLSLGELVDCGLYYTRNDEKQIPPRNKREWLRAVKYALRQEGDNVWASIEGCPNETRKRFEKTASWEFPTPPQ